MGDGFLPILGDAAAAPKPCEGAFYDPPARQNLEAVRGVGAPDDLDRPLAHMSDSLNIRVVERGSGMNTTSPRPAPFGLQSGHELL